jgi:hypothetical protein
MGYIIPEKMELIVSNSNFALKIFNTKKYGNHNDFRLQRTLLSYAYDEDYQDYERS